MIQTYPLVIPSIIIHVFIAFLSPVPQPVTCWITFPTIQISIPLGPMHFD